MLPPAQAAAAEYAVRAIAFRPLRWALASADTVRAASWERQLRELHIRLRQQVQTTVEIEKE